MEALSPRAGKLSVCATPIGNLEDITLRVLRVLKEADLIAAEDTRHTRKLLSYYEIHTPLTAYHDHNRLSKGQDLLRQMEEGRHIALVSDAGLPGISDPGEDLVRITVEKGLPVEVLPGPSASLAALVLSGFPTSKFVFDGFLPRHKKERRKRLHELAGENRTMIFYEAPHRMVQTLADMAEVFGLQRRVVLVRELTKKFEEVRRGTMETLLDSAVKDGVKGECTLVVEAGAPLNEVDQSLKELPQDEAGMSQLIKEKILYWQQQGLDSKEALKKAAKELNMPKRDVYRLQLMSKD